MKLLRTILSAGLLLAAPAVEAAKSRGEDPKEDALYDINTGMAGLQQATKDPKLLAQLMQDMNDPELMKEAQKMMESPEFKKQMKKFGKSKDFKQATQKAKAMMNDPATSARMEAQMEHMLKRGQDSLKKDAKSSMAEAMEAMYTDPDVLAEAAKMVADPEFQQNMAKMAEDPAFASYIAAMKDMMEDPAQKGRMEEMQREMQKMMA